jgi:hypothetical protein
MTEILQAGNDEGKEGLLIQINPSIRFTYEIIL